jgi:peroxiredoxin
MVALFALLAGGASALNSNPNPNPNLKLNLNQIAPDFTLPDAAGKAWHLAAHLGRDRLLVVSQPPGSTLDEYTRQAAVLKDYDLWVVALMLPGDPALKSALERPASEHLVVLADPGGKVTARYGRAALIGKDRGVKAMYSAVPNLNDVLELVNSMPMRQQERREQGR